MSTTTPSPESTHPYRAAAPRLGEPPRHVPLSAKIPLALGGTVASLGWFFLIVGSVLCWAIVSKLDVGGVVHHGPYQTAPANVLRIVKTKMQLDHRPVHEVGYVMTVDGLRYTDRSYTEEEPPAVGSTLLAEFERGHPSESHLRGMRRRPMPIWTVFVLVFPLLGAGAIWFGTRAGRRAIGLLRYGRLAKARCVEQSATRVSINHKPVYRVVLRFEADDESEHETVARTHRPERLAGETPVLYLQADPGQATALEHLPGPPRFAADGTLQGRPGAAAGYLLLAASMVAVNLVAAWLVLA